MLSFMSWELLTDSENSLPSEMQRTKLCCVAAFHVVILCDQSVGMEGWESVEITDAKKPHFHQTHDYLSFKVIWLLIP